MEQLDFIEVDFEDVKLNANGLRNCRTEVGDVSSLKKSIAEGTKKLLTPMIVWVGGDDDAPTYTLLAGFRRYEAIRQIRESDPSKFESIIVSAFYGTLDDALGFNIEENLQRRNLNPADQAVAVNRLYERIGDQATIGQMLGMSQGWISQKVNLVRGLIPEGMEALRNDNIKENFARRLSKMLNEDGSPDVDTQLEVLEAYFNEGTQDEEDGKITHRRKKTYRTKREVEELRVSLTTLEDTGIDQDYVRGILNTVRWFGCEAEADKILSDDVQELIVDAEATVVELVEQEEAPQRRRRIASSSEG